MGIVGLRLMRVEKLLGTIDLSTIYRTLDSLAGPPRVTALGIKFVNGWDFGIYLPLIFIPFCILEAIQAI